MVYTNKLKFTRLQNKIFRLFCKKAGERLSQRDMARILDVSPTAIGKSIKQLEGLIEIKKEKNINLHKIGLNRDNQKAIEMKRVENLEVIYESELIDFLNDHLPGTTIILFGSYSRGEDTIDSDVDVAIIGSEEKILDLEKYEDILEREISINYYKDFEEINQHLKRNLMNGIILHGAL